MRFGQGAFAVAPGNFLDGHHAAPAAIDATHGVQQEDEESPQRNELKTSFRELVVAGRRQMAARAYCDRTFARSQDHSMLFLSVLKRAAHRQTSEMMAAVQDRGQLHGAKWSSGETSTINRFRT